MQKRKEIVRHDGQCFLCLKTGHRIKECLVTKKCQKWNSCHHQSFCLSKGEESINVVNEILIIDVNNEGEQPESCKDPGTWENVITNNRKEKTQNQNLLQTATMMAFYDETGKRVPVQVLMDSSSQCSYV